LADLTAVVATWFDEQCQPLGEPLENLGERVKIEAIAEMCALKALMKVAEGESGFEHKKFFEEYARFNADIQEEELFVETINTSVAPLAATRVNLALGQLDKFTETVGLEKGDLMATAESEKLGIF
jgi:predicted metalloendopeptidase